MTSWETLGPEPLGLPDLPRLPLSRLSALNKVCMSDFPEVGDLLRRDWSQGSHSHRLVRVLSSSNS